MPAPSKHDPDTALGGAADRFPETQASLVAAISAGGEITADAMERIAALHWKPVYKFVRIKFGLSNEDAKDLTQAFFGNALEREFFARFDPSRAAFRTYLQMVLSGWFARRVRSMGWDIVAGSALGLFFAYLAAVMPSQNGHHYYVEIMLPGFVVGAILGFLTQRMGTPAPVKRTS